MKIKTFAAIAAVFALSAPLASANEINPVLGRVGDFSIRETDLDRLIATQSPQAQKQITEKPELRDSLVRDLLLKKAIAMKARKDGYDRKPEYREKLSYLVDDFLAQEYLARVVLADIKVSEEEMKKYYKEQEQEFLLTESVKARHIFIQLAATATEEEKTAARKKAEDVLARLKKGEDFAKVAQETSEDADTAKNGGALGLLTPGKTNSQEFEKAAFALKTGEISDIVKSPFGLHIIKADEKTDKRIATFDESKSYIEAVLKKELEQKKGEEFVSQVYRESGIEVFSDKPAAGEEAAAPLKK